MVTITDLVTGGSPAPNYDSMTLEELQALRAKITGAAPAPAAQADDGWGLYSKDNPVLRGGGRELTDFGTGIIDTANDYAPETTADAINWFARAMGSKRKYTPEEIKAAIGKQDASIQQERKNDPNPVWAGIGGALSSPLNAVPVVRGGGALANLVGNGVLQGTLSGATQTTTGDESRGGNALKGGATGGITSAAIGTALRPFVGKLGKEDQRLLNVLDAEGVPVSPAKRTDSRILRGIETAFGDLPQTAGAQAAKQGTQSGAFNRAVLKRAGIAASEATPGTLEEARQAFSSRYDDLTSRNPIKVDDELFQKLVDIDSKAVRRLGKSNTIIRSYIDDIASFAETGKPMEGAVYQQARSDLSGLSKSTDTPIALLAGELKTALDSAAHRSISPADAKAWQQLNREYANFKTISKAQGGTGDATLGGGISPAGLLGAVKTGNKGYATGRGELNDLARAGTRFLRDSTPNSGTTARMGNQAVLGHVINAVLGVGGTAAGGVPGALAALAAPKVAQVIYDAKPVQKYLVGAISPKIGEALTKAAITGSAATQDMQPSPVSPPGSPNYDSMSLEELKALRESLSPQSSTAPLLDRIQSVESGGNPNARSPDSTASGAYQFTDPTWNSMVSRYGKRTGITAGMKADPQAQRTMAGLLVQEHREDLRQVLKREPTEGELYLAHFVGAGGAKRILKMKNKGAPAATVLDRAARVKSNRPLFYDGGRQRTVQEFINIVTGKV